MTQEIKKTERAKRDNGPSLADCVDGPYRLAVCPACGKPFGKNPTFTIAGWFKFGTPEKSDMVHWGCRHIRRPKAAG